MSDILLNDDHEAVSPVLVLLLFVLRSRDTHVVVFWCGEEMTEKRGI